MVKHSAVVRLTQLAVVLVISPAVETWRCLKGSEKAEHVLCWMRPQWLAQLRNRSQVKEMEIVLVGLH